MVLGRDADAGVLHRDLDARRVLLRRHGHAAAIGSELDRVGEEVQHDLLELALVGPERPEVLVDLEREIDPVALGALAHEHHRVRERRGQVEG